MRTAPALPVRSPDHEGASGGTPPGDRVFRPDVQGLRAIAILLVVLFHAGVSGLSGGYVGVDVFFVISGFVITGVLLRERDSGGGSSLRRFYERRARRIIPAATLVIVATVLGAYLWLGSVSGLQTAVDGRWAALFLANFHFAASSTNYLASTRPPSALQNYWSLAVEEQFYVVYPSVFLLAAKLVARRSLQLKLTVLLGATVIASYALSIVLTSVNPANAFFSPFTRAWELALGGLIALGSTKLRGLPEWMAAGSSWLGIGAIVLAATTFTSSTAYPGWLVAVPVIGAGLIIGGGTAQPRWGAEWLLRLRGFQLLGLISFSLYLWHWPILIIATQARGVSNLPTADNLLLVLVAGALATGTYVVVENPIRRSRALRSRRWSSLVMGLCLTLVALSTTTFAIRNTDQTDTGIAAATPGSQCHSQDRNAELAWRSDLRSEPTSIPASASKQSIWVEVIGDSTSCTMMPGLAAVGGTYGVHVEDGAVIGCGIVSGEAAPYYFDGQNVERLTKSCQSRARSVEDKAMEKVRPSIIVWGSQEERASILATTQGGAEVLVKGTSAWRSVMMQRIDARVRELLSTGAKVMLLLQPPLVHSGSQTQPNEQDLDFIRLNAMLTEEASRHPGKVEAVNLDAQVCPSGPPCPYVVDGIYVRPDDAHYGVPGAIWVAKWLIPKIVQFDESHHG